jgi:hypothetical protein
MRGNMSLVADGGGFLTSTFKSHLLQLAFLSIAVNFIPTKESPALSLLVDCPMLFSIKGLQECSR